MQAAEAESSLLPPWRWGAHRTLAPQAEAARDRQDRAYVHALVLACFAAQNRCLLTTRSLLDASLQMFRSGFLLDEVQQALAMRGAPAGSAPRPACRRCSAQAAAAAQRRLGDPRGAAQPHRAGRPALLGGPLLLHSPAGGPAAPTPGARPRWRAWPGMVCAALACRASAAQDLLASEAATGRMMQGLRRFAANILRQWEDGLDTRRLLLQQVPS